MFKKLFNIINGGSSASLPDGSPASSTDEGVPVLISPKLTGTALLYHSLNRKALEIFQDSLQDLDYEQKSELYEEACKSIRAVLSGEPSSYESGLMEACRHTGRTFRQKIIDEFMEDIDEVGGSKGKNRTIH